ncbi:MAG: TIGR03915 family putative DNA repair protein [Lachnospiraceae bacterium]|nr:TIGR03915 family putative DNA repair protein [Lachnospiraceae bacterium]
MADGYREIILVCEPALEGILTAIYQAYEWKLIQENTRIQTGADDLNLFADYREVWTQPYKAAKVADTLIRRFGADTYEDICFAAASGSSDRAQAIYETVVLGLSGQVKGKLLQALTYDCVQRVFELARRVRKEEHRMKMFVRFRELEGGLLFSRIEPDADVTAFVMPHFADRFPLENFVIADTKRGIAGVHPSGKPWFLMHLQESECLAFENMEGRYTQQEREINLLIRRFTESISIEERENRKLQKHFMPLKYRSFMTECEDRL